MKNILFTLTTFLSSEGKLKQCIKCLKSIEKYEPNIKKKCFVLIINECGETSGQFLKKEFPWIDKIIDKGNIKDKSGKKCGQSSSLNIGISYLKKEKRFKYWIHWEESWVATKSFLQLCYDAMKMNIDCLQISDNDGYQSLKRVHTPHNRYIFIEHFPNNDYDFKTLCKCNSKKCCCKRKKNELKARSKTIKQHKKCKECFSDKCEKDKWFPNWSLRPGIERREKVLAVGYFNTDPKFWPVHFELEWAYNWITQPGGVTKAISVCSKRQDGHISFSDKNL